MNYYASFFAQENADLLVSLRGAIFFDSKKKGVDQVLISMGIGELPRFLSHGTIQILTSLQPSAHCKPSVEKMG